MPVQSPLFAELRQRSVTGPNPVEILLGPGFDAEGRWTAPSGVIEATFVPHAALSTEAGGVLARLRAMVSRLQPGQAVAGYLAYEVAGEIEPVLALPPPPDGLPAACFARFAGVEGAAPPAPHGTARPIRHSAGQEDAASYRGRVAEIVRRIGEGDLFQANLSRRLSAVFADEPGLADALFAQLTAGSDAAYAAKIEMSQGAVLSASPELFLAVRSGSAIAEPIKGTRPRGRTPQADAALAQALQADEKDRAENIMIADLLRNDLSRVAADGSVREEAVCALRSLPRVHHLYSRITGRLRPDCNAVDALEACFPCGSITGAPKIAAMQTIAELEGEGRGPYCGTVFSIQANGDAVFSVPIRTGVLTRLKGEARLDVRAGGGITILSDPQTEWRETVDKAYPFDLMTA